MIRDGRILAVLTGRFGRRNALTAPSFASPYDAVRSADTQKSAFMNAVRSDRHAAPSCRVFNRPARIWTTLMLRDEVERNLHQWRDDLPTAWRKSLEGVEPKFDAIPRHASIEQDAQIVPARRKGRGILYALEGIDPSDVVAVVLGNHPYPDPIRATGRSFEQGDLTQWMDDLAAPSRVTPSLLSLVCAAAALLPGAAGLGLDQGHVRGRRAKLLHALKEGQVVLPSPRSMFEILTGQGVLWINRTPTISVFHTGRHHGGSSWHAIEEQRTWHRALWRPVTHAIVSSLVGQAQRRLIVFGLFGGDARDLRRRIEAQGRQLSVPTANLRFVESGHPSLPRHFFGAGNPLGRINDELTVGGYDPIDWCGPTAERTAANGVSARSIAIIDRTVGKYRQALKRLAEK